jgi:hypothetical protein
MNAPRRDCNKSRHARRIDPFTETPPGSPTETARHSWLQLEALQFISRRETPDGVPSYMKRNGENAKPEPDLMIGAVSPYHRDSGLFSTQTHSGSKCNGFVRKGGTRPHMMYWGCGTKQSPASFGVDTYVRDETSPGLEKRYITPPEVPIDTLSVLSQPVLSILSDNCRRRSLTVFRVDGKPYVALECTLIKSGERSESCLRMCRPHV